jgi:BCCT family betaine/carnitine transporter
MIATGGDEVLQTLTIIIAFPLIFVLVIVILSFRKWLVEDRAELRYVGGTAESDRQLPTDEARALHQEEDSPTPARQSSMESYSRGFLTGSAV